MIKIRQTITINYLRRLAQKYDSEALKAKNIKIRRKFQRRSDRIVNVILLILNT